MISWVSKTWREQITQETIVNAFIKSKFAENFKNMPQTFQAEVGQIIDDLDNIDFDNPYLDDIEEEWLENSELELE